MENKEEVQITENQTEQQYDQSVQPKWYERIIGAIVALLMGGW